MPEEKRITIGADKAGFGLKNALKDHLIEIGYNVKDVGMVSEDVFVPFFDAAGNVAKSIQSGEFMKGLLCCGTGMGVSLVANKYKGIRASVVESLYTAKNSRVINNSNIICMGGWVTAPEMAIEMLDVWLSTEFKEGFPAGRHSFLDVSQAVIKDIEDKNFK